MPANTAPIFPAQPIILTANLTAALACTSRAPVAHASLSAAPVNAVQLSAPSTNGRRVDQITIKAAANAIGGASVAQLVLIWYSDGVNAYVVDEIAISSITPSTTAASAVASKSYTTMVLPPNGSLWVSTTIATSAATTALSAILYGGDY